MKRKNKNGKAKMEKQKIMKEAKKIKSEKAKKSETVLQKFFVLEIKKIN